MIVKKGTNERKGKWQWLSRGSGAILQTIAHTIHTGEF